MSKASVVNQIVDSFKANTNSKGQVIKQDVNALQGYKITLGEDEFEALMSTMRNANLIKGSRGGTSDSKECKQVRNEYEKFLKSLQSQGIISRDEEFYSLTKKARFVVLDSNNDRILPSLNMSNVDSKIRKAQEKEANEISK